MANIKRWSTGKIGNSYSDHTSDGNPNSKGLDTDGLPGVEGYIEEDPVVASNDNRPLKNLVENDGILSDNITDVASEVDNGVFSDKYDTFDLTIESQDYYSDPESDSDEIYINNIRVASGSAIVNGQVTRIGNQKLIYFYRDDDSDSILFPDYDSSTNTYQVEIYDNDYFSDSTTRAFGSYTPVYSTQTDDLPDNYEDYEVIITQKDTADSTRKKVSIYDTYRDWEDIIPFKAHSDAVTSEVASFNSDLNYGQDSDGYWLSCGNVKNTRVSDVKISKDIVIQDKAISASEFTASGTSYVKSIVTDGLFFKDLKWGSNENYSYKADIQDVYVDSNSNVYFIQRSNDSTYKKLLKLTNNSTQLEVKDIGTGNSLNLHLKNIGDYLIILGTSGMVKMIKLSDDFSSGSVYTLANFSTTEDIQDLMTWDGKIWIAGTKTIWYTDYSTFDPTTSTFTEIDISNYTVDSTGASVLKHLNKLLSVTGNYVVSSSLSTDIVNILKNSSYEDGGIGNTPNYWTLEENASGSTLKITSDVKSVGNYSALLKKSITSSYCSATQTVKYTSAAAYTFSVYLKSNIDTTDKVVLYVYELDSSGNTLTSSTKEIVPTTTFARYNLSHTIVNTSTVASIKVEVRSYVVANTTECVYVDAAQLEEGTTANEYVETFNYLFIGFTKTSSDILNPPFAFIDQIDPYNVKYIQGSYGEIKSVNDACFDEHNRIVFIDDINLYRLTLLNNRNEYDRFSINRFIDHTNDTYNNIKKFEVIKKIGGKYYYGGTVDNRVVKIESANTGDQTITISESAAGNGESLITLLGGYTTIGYSDSRNEAVQFNRIAPCYATTDNATHAGQYIPGLNYSFNIAFNDGTSQLVTITAPTLNNDPWTIDDIAASLKSITLPTGLQWVDTITSDSDLIYTDWYKISSSVTVSDGFYSSNGKNQETHIRGNIHSVFVKSSTVFYIAKDNQIFKSKVDSNLLKSGSTYSSTNWDLYSTGHSLDEYNTVVNKKVQFNDDNYDRSWVDLDIGTGYSLLPGTLRVKTNTTTEVGYQENIDYFVDYDNAKIMRSKNTNFLQNSSLSSISGSAISNWSCYSDSTKSYALNQISIDNEFTDYAIKMYANSDATTMAMYQSVTAQSISGVANLQVGDTYTFSVYLQSNNTQTPSIRLVETTDSYADSFTKTFDSTAYTSKDCALTTANTWTRFDISHTITSSTSTLLRVEIYSKSTTQMLVCKPQLEKNPIVTPYIEGTIKTEIDPDSYVYVDFVRVKSLTSGTDYTFDTTNRKVVLASTPNTDSTYYLKYKYTKVFNAYDFGDAKPTTDVVDYTDNDDYFIFTLEGKIWAINQNFALLSLDTTNPLKISYKYYYPRVDQLKIRNTPDKYGNYLYLVKGTYSSNNPYRPIDTGITTNRYVYNTSFDDISDLTDTTVFDNTNNEILYEFNVTSNDYTKNDVYDRRIYTNAKEHTLFNISLYPETVAYFQFTKDFNSTNGLSPLNTLNSSKIVPIIKNYDVSQNTEIGAYHSSYQYTLRNNTNMVTPATAKSIFVDPTSGSDSNGGTSVGDAVKTITCALTLLTSTKCNIIITKNAIISENIEINKDFPVYIFCSSYCFWQGGLQNLTELYVQGIWFQNTNIYCFNNLNIYYCTFENTGINCVYPETVYIYNSEFEDCHNAIIRVKDVISPSPFTFPYEKFDLRDDGTANTTNSKIATSENESIAPGDSYYDSSLSTQPEGTYTLYRCLIHDSNDSIIKYDPTVDWVSTFYFSYCTIANNVDIISTDISDLTIKFENSILYDNIVTKSVSGGTKSVVFNSDSDITFYNCFIDFSSTAADTEINLGSGTLINRDSCIGKSTDSTPGFIGASGDTYDYHLKSLAKGSSVDSICLDAGVSGDIGAYDETRTQQDKNLPKKLRSYVAYLGEGVVYPVRLNSEKITVTLEFKPDGSVSQSGIILDSRASADDVDYFALVYNNNDTTDTSLTQSATTSSSNAYHFRVIVANKEKSYSIVSPIEISTDEEFQIWHRISFTINYEDIYNTKSSFVEKDKKQNIITLYHNDTITQESFIKYDLNRYVDGDLIPDLSGDDYNSWNYNYISQIVTLGSDYNNSNKMTGYYTELRLDNRFVDRKQFDTWNAKELPFADPFSYVNQTPIARTIDLDILNEYWSLKSKSDVGAKGGTFTSDSAKRYSYDNGDLVWNLTASVDNKFSNAAFDSVNTACVVADSIIDWSSTHAVSNTISIKTTNSRLASDNAGIILNLKDPALSGYTSSKITLSSKSDLTAALNYAFSLVPQTLISWCYTKDGKVKFYTKDWGLSSVTLSITMTSPDNTALGFSSVSKSGVRTVGGYTVEGLTTTNANPNSDVANANNMWTCYNSDYEELGSNMLFVKKNSSPQSEDVLKIYQQFNLSTTNPYYTFSVYINSQDTIDNTSIQMLYGNTVKDFDSISKYKGNWWICTKQIEVTAASSNTIIGIEFLAEGNYVVGGMQFENKYFSGPFSTIADSTNGVLIVPKNYVSSDSGVIAFKFKPLFNFYDTSTRYLLESVGNDDGTLVEDQGFRITYSYSTKRKKGVVEFSINNTDCQWDVEVVAKYWYKWHTCIINYDFNINRFVLWFDSYNDVIDQSITAYTQTDLYIGHGVPDVSGTDRTTAEVSSDIQVKDIIITDYPITDTESLNWVNANEFYNESLIVNTIQKYKDEVEDYVNSSNNIVSVTNDLIDQVTALQTSVSAIDTENTTITNNYTALNTKVTSIGDRVTTLESDISTIDTQESNIQNTLKYIENGAASGGSWSTTTAAAGANLSKLRTDIDTVSSNLVKETNSRITADSTIRSDLASTSSTAPGGKLIGIASTGLFSGTTIEAALEELAGTGRTTETVYGIAQTISSIQTAESSQVTTINLMKDGNTGTWTQAKASNNGWNVATLRSDVDTNSTAIAAANTAIANTNVVLGNSVTDLNSKITAVYTDFASTASGKGASLVGFDNTTLFSSMNLQAALEELAGTGRNSSMTVAGNYSSIQILQSTLSNANTIIQEINTVATEASNKVNEALDGNDGSTWTDSTWNLVKHESRLDTLDTQTSDISATLDSHTLSIDSAVSRISTLETGLSTETTTRQNADNLFKSSEANKGASLIGINDSASNYSSSNVEGALAEVATKLSALAGSLAWKDAVATYNDLPITGNTLGDARTVKSDTDGHQSQYVCVAITGAIADQWKKIADIDWGNASAISYNNTSSGMSATNVNDAIDEVYDRTKSLSKYEATILATGWTLVDGEYNITIAHDLGTTNVTAMIIDSDTGMMVGVDEIVRVDSNSIKLISTSSFNAIVTVFAVVDRFTTITNTWTPEGSGKYYHDITHNFGTKAVMVSVFDIGSGERVGVDNIEILSENAIRIHIADNTTVANIFITKSVQNAITKDIETWTASGSSYIATMPNSTGYDAIYAFFDSSTGKTVTIDETIISGGTLTLKKSNSDSLRMVIIQ